MNEEICDNYFFEKFSLALSDLRLALAALQRANELAGLANIEHINPVAFELLKDRVVKLCDLSTDQYTQAVLSGELKKVTDDVALATQALTSPSVPYIH